MLMSPRYLQYMLSFASVFMCFLLLCGYCGKKNHMHLPGFVGLVSCSRVQCSLSLSHQSVMFPYLFFPSPSVKPACLGLCCHGNRTSCFISTVSRPLQCAQFSPCLINSSCVPSRFLSLSPRSLFPLLFPVSSQFQVLFSCLMHFIIKSQTCQTCLDW